MSCRVPSHVAWVVPATAPAMRAAARVLTAVGARVHGRELLVARRQADRPRSPLKTLRALAQDRHAPVLLVPSLPDVEPSPDHALREAR